MFRIAEKGYCHQQDARQEKESQRKTSRSEEEKKDDQDWKKRLFMVSSSGRQGKYMIQNHGDGSGTGN